MKKGVKIILAFLGAIEVIFHAFIPISLSLLLVKIYPLTAVQATTVIIAGSLSSLYRAIRVGLVKK